MVSAGNPSLFLLLTCCPWLAGEPVPPKLCLSVGVHWGKWHYSTAFLWFLKYFIIILFIWLLVNRIQQLEKVYLLESLVLM